MNTPTRPAPPSTTAAPTESQVRFAGRLYTRYSADLLSMFRSTRSMSKADAIDLLQQTFSELLATLGRNHDLVVEHPRAFLFKLATRQLYATYRRAQRAPAVEDGAEVAELPSPAEADDVEYRASLRAEQRLMLRAMRRLTNDEAEAKSEAGTPLAGAAPTARESSGVSRLQLLLYLRFWIGLTLAEVAEIFDMTPAMVSGRQRRGLIKLQRIVAELEAASGISASTSTTVLTRWREVLELEAGEGRRGAAVGS